ncbi:MAG: glycoside hydrolase superfamily [Chthoniobacteraceae bacterium]|nr:glycoside hydrolase superfamily [Chthoniobacteraceae bacterium]
MLEIEYISRDVCLPGYAVYVALATDPLTGCAVVPFGQGAEGSTVFLPFRANRIYYVVHTADGAIRKMRIWRQTQWSPSCDVTGEFDVIYSDKAIRIRIADTQLDGASRVDAVIYAKCLRENDGWGRILANMERGISGGYGDQYLSEFKRIDVEKGRTNPCSRLGAERVKIYQLLPRLFSNVNKRRKLNGTLEENGTGKFDEINSTALSEIQAMGFTHLWLTGILRQATATDYSEIGLPADDPDLLKGLAGSPYAIKDYFDLCPDYARNPEARLGEFALLLERIRSAGLRVIIDFVPNHVARSYSSTVLPGLSFGADDKPDKFFDPQNNFYYLSGKTLELPTWKHGVSISPTCKLLGTCDGRFNGELDYARVTGNNVTSECPSLNDWYETVKLNYGFDYTSERRAYSHGSTPPQPIPDTWLKMDRVLAYWQALGIDGFRADMAHMVPPEFWAWAIGRARSRNPAVLFLAEAYNNDSMKVPNGDPLFAALDDRKGNVMFDLLSAGFDAVYDDPTYKKLKALYDGCGWANDIDAVLGHPFIFQNSLRYSENHDEVRLASQDNWGGVGMNVGRPVSAILYGLSRGPVLFYHGQEVGEPASGPAGFGGDNARTTIFDYWSMPELAKWVNDHRYDGGGLSESQNELRKFYSRLLNIVGESAFRDGGFFPLNPCNILNARYGRLSGESASGHWLYAFMRYEDAGGQRFLVIANLHPSESLRDVHVWLPMEALEFLNLPADQGASLTECLSSEPRRVIHIQALGDGVAVGDIPPLTPLYFELQLKPR